MSVNKIDELIEKTRSLISKNISFEELGVANNFSEAERIKNKISEYVIDILESAKKYIGDQQHIMLPTYLKSMNSYINQAGDVSENIKKNAIEGIHNPDFPNKRSNFVQQLAQIETDLRKGMHSFVTELEILKLKNSLPNVSSIKGLISEIEQLKSRIQDSASEINKILENVRSKSTDKAISESTTGFSKLKVSHGRWEKFWFIVLLFSLIFVSLALYRALSHEINTTDIQALIKLIKNILMVSIPAIFLRISIGKYNLERNLKIIYTNRETVLDQFKNFENAIGDNAEAKNQFRLEIAKYIFSDPNTGYLGDGSNASGVSINPVINLAGKE